MNGICITYLAKHTHSCPQHYQLADTLLRIAFFSAYVELDNISQHSLNTSWHHNMQVSNVFMWYDKPLLHREQDKGIESPDLLLLLSIPNSQQDFHYTVFSIKTPPRVLQNHLASKKNVPAGMHKIQNMSGSVFWLFLRNTLQAIKVINRRGEEFEEGDKPLCF